MKRNKMMAIMAAQTTQMFYAMQNYQAIVRTGKDEGMRTVECTIFYENWEQLENIRGTKNLNLKEGDFYEERKSGDKAKWVNFEYTYQL